MRVWCAALGLGVVACGGSDVPGPRGPCDPTSDACEVTHAFGAYSIEAGGEIDGVCMSWTLDNDAPLFINGVRTENDGMFHHSNWFFVPDDKYPEDGHWPCWENDFSEQSAALQGGVLYAQSTQVSSEEQRFRPGAALRVPARSKIIAYTHILNTSAASQDTEMRVTLETIPEGDVDLLLAPFRLNYGALEIPPMATSEFEGRCDVSAAYDVFALPFELKLHWVLPHFHGLGRSFRLGQVGGDRDGEDIFTLEDAYGEPLGHMFDEPFDVAANGGIGVSFSCGYDNNTDQTVGFGIGDQEMCVMLGFAESGFLFDGYVDQSDGVTMDGGIMRGTGPCTVVGAPYNTNQ